MPDLIIAEEDTDITPLVEPQLLQSLAEVNEQAENTSFAFSARDENGEIVAALTAGTAYGWMVIKLLWVADSHRRHGLGKSLIEKAESKARSVGCHGAWLDTSNEAAQKFYATLGYETFGKLQNDPDQKPSRHRRWFMKKAL